jgi:hypothetical protein
MNAAVRELISEIVAEGSPIVPIVADAPPDNPAQNTLWCDTVSGGLYAWRGAWVGLTAPLRP